MILTFLGTYSTGVGKVAKENCGPAARSGSDEGNSTGEGCELIEISGKKGWHQQSMTKDTNFNVRSEGIPA